LRRWLENHIVAKVLVDDHPDSVEIPLRLNFYCVEALRRQCLCELLRAGMSGRRSRLTFGFRPLGAETVRVEVPAEAVAAVNPSVA
jgi:hypothetical protein